MFCFAILRYAILQPHQFFPELWLTIHFGNESHLVNNLALDIDAGSHFNQINSILSQFEYGALRYIENGLARFISILAAECNLFHLFDKFLLSALRDNLKLTVVK